VARAEEVGEDIGVEVQVKGRLEMEGVMILIELA
jgi:hypothetical protein